MCYFHSKGNKESARLARVGARERTNSFVGQATASRHGKDGIVAVGDAIDGVLRPIVRVGGEDVAVHLSEGALFSGFDKFSLALLLSRCTTHLRLPLSDGKGSLKHDFS